MMIVTPYLDFNGRCEEAINFYKQAVGADSVQMMRFSESPEPTQVAPGSENKVMHACFRVGENQIMASDGYCTGSTKFEGINLALEVATIADADRVFAALSEGGQVKMPLTQTFFSPKFGMLADRFGITWMVLVKQQQ
jgi:PhnB protein